jgi:DNA-binding CsgD family transcriptional regulator
MGLVFGDMLVAPGSEVRFTSCSPVSLFRLRAEVDTNMESSGTARQAFLSLRQLEVVKLIADGLSSKQIAAQLGVSTKTANFHRTQINRRLGVKGIAGIVRWAIRNGVIEA